MTGHYLQASGADRHEFRKNAAILAAQRNAKIIGIFARLAKRDKKLRYLSYLPRVWRYLQRSLNHPAMGNLAAWYKTHVPPPEGLEAANGGK